MKFLTKTKINFFIACMMTCLTLTACDNTEDTQQEVMLTPVKTTIDNNNTDEEANLQELDALLDKASEETAQPQVADNLQVKPLKKIANNTNILAMTLSKGLATGFNYQLANNNQWKQAEKDCFGKLNNDFAVTELEKILKEELSEEEWQQATNFYQSSAGKQLAEWRDTHLDDVVKNNNISMSDMDFSEEDLAEITQFMSSSANIKINQLIQSAEIERLVTKKIAPQLLACGMAEIDQ